MRKKTINGENIFKFKTQIQFYNKIEFNHIVV